MPPLELAAVSWTWAGAPPSLVVATELIFAEDRVLYLRSPVRKETGSCKVGISNGNEDRVLAFLGSTKSVLWRSDVCYRGVMLSESGVHSEGLSARMDGSQLPILPRETNNAHILCRPSIQNVECVECWVI